MFELAFLGIIIGLLSGLLGIGGGVVTVPALKYILEYQMGIDSSISMHIAVANSLAIVIFTSSMTALIYYRRNLLNWQIFFQFCPGILIGVLSGTILAGHLHGPYYAQLFAIYLTYISFKMLFLTPKQQHASLQSEFTLKPNASFYFISVLTGFLSAILGIGGGTMMTPFFLHLGLDMLTAIGTSTLICIPIAIIGSISYGIHYLHIQIPLEHTTGYLYWPAIMAISLASMMTSPLGARLARKIEAAYLKKIFACTMLAIAIKMFCN
jgi:uncharacterized membrane protein YfcA